MENNNNIFKVKEGSARMNNGCWVVVGNLVSGKITKGMKVTINYINPGFLESLGFKAKVIKNEVGTVIGFEQGQNHPEILDTPEMETGILLSGFKIVSQAASVTIKITPGEYSFE